MLNIELLSMELNQAEDIHLHTKTINNVYKQNI